MLICWPNDVRKMYGLPACVMSAASAPVICGTSACWQRIMFTFTEPENTGPRITYGSESIAFCTWAREVPGLLCVSDCGALILRPRMPPLALISSMASTAPSRKLVPDTAPAPESSITIGMLTVCCAPATPAASASDIATRLRFMVLSSRWTLFRRLGDDIRLDDFPQLRRDLRVAAEPFAKAESRLLQEHAEPIDRAMTAFLGLREQRGFERHVDDVVHHRLVLQRLEIDHQRILAVHAERSAVHSTSACARSFGTSLQPCAVAPKRLANSSARAGVRLTICTSTPRCFSA